MELAKKFSSEDLGENRGVLVLREIDGSEQVLRAPDSILDRFPEPPHHLYSASAGDLAAAAKLFAEDPELAWDDLGLS